MLTQSLAACVQQVSGNRIDAQLCVNPTNTTLRIRAVPGGGMIKLESAPTGSAEAGTLLSYFDTATGELSAAGEAYVLALPASDWVDGLAGTLGNYFA